MNELLINDRVMRKLLPRIQATAEFLKKAAERNQHILIKFDGDGDGICSGLNMLKALRRVSHNKRISNYPGPSAVYRIEEALNDLNRAESTKETVFLFLDHAANEESVDALHLLKSYGARIVIIDHHPFSTKTKALAERMVSPMLVSKDGASYVTGLLAYEVAKRIAPEEADDALAWYALQADKSRFASKKEFMEPIAIEYLEFFRRNNSLEFYEKTLADSETVKESCHQAKEKIGQALTLAKRNAEYKKSRRFTSAVVRVAKCVPEGDYPSKSRLISEFQQLMEKKHENLVSLGVDSDSMSFRASKKALKNGFRASQIIRQLKDMFGTEIISGGGHDVAASLKANPSAIHAIVHEALALVEKPKK
ncbi:hypothetical protein KJ765_06630 [Candidatus Micrarchaeota archaeon]|nr:hypothetical protein [Candidatus Micrarchaeota archaeon]